MRIARIYHEKSQILFFTILEKKYCVFLSYSNDGKDNNVPALID